MFMSLAGKPAPAFPGHEPEAPLDVTAIAHFVLGQIEKLFFSLGSHFSVTSLFAALVFAALFLVIKRVERGRPIKLRTLIRALFPRRILCSRSNLADLGFMVFNVFVFGVIFGWAVLQYQFIANGLAHGLALALGQPAPSALPQWTQRIVLTVMLFLSYELGYWLNHWLAHRVPLLWEFHKVHHTATVLTPLTNFRVHPVYTWVFANILSFTAAVATGLGAYLFGDTTYQYALTDTNIILVFFIHTYVHLQHTELWIAFTGWLGRVLVSPAHHQVHHSTNPKHFNKNFGSCLALWDWMFGTLYVPQQQSEKLSFGVDADRADAHTFAVARIRTLLRAQDGPVGLRDEKQTQRA
jgi:sterol desaturase/sphingolipid hydroxylase (fatty acid hydroxylase superfamily)